MSDMNYTLFEGPEFLKDYKKNPGKYMKLPSIAFEKGRTGCGWNAGAFEDGRTFFADCWGEEWCTFLSFRVNTKGIEKYTAEELDRLLRDHGLFTLKDTYPCEQEITLTEHDENGDSYFYMCIVVGDEDETYMTDGGHIWGFKFLDEINSNPN